MDVPPDFLHHTLAVNIVAIVVVAVIAHAITRRVFDHHLQRALTSDRRTGITFLRNGVKGTIVFAAALGVIYSIPPLRSLAVGVFAGASILAAFIGFASQQAFSNIVSGVFIVLFKPFRVDDIIKIRGEIGTIEDITLRHTVIRALENKRLIYPNSVIDAEAIINWTIRDERAQKYMYISIGYEADLERAVTIIREEVAKHPDLLDTRTQEERDGDAPLVDVPVLDFEHQMVNFRVPVWGRDLPTAMRMTWDLHASIKLRFDAEGIPFGRPARVNYDGEALSRRGARG